MALDGEQADQDRERDPHDVRLERIADDAEPFDGRDHRDRRGQHRVGVKKRCGEQRGHQQPSLRRSRAEPPLNERVERQATPLALIVAAHDDEDVFDRDDEHERPEDQARDAVQICHDQIQVVARIERRLERVQWRRADVAKDDAKRAEGQCSFRVPLDFARRVDRTADWLGNCCHGHNVRSGRIKIPCG